MSRINLKLPFDDLLQLQTACYKKHFDDGQESVLISYLDTAKIDFAMDVADGATAAAHNISMNELLASSELATANRNKSFLPLWKMTRKWAQALKKIYIGNEKELTLWGIPINKKGKIKYPVPFEKKLTISQNIIAKNNSYAAGKSPLQAFITINNNDLPTLMADASDALAYDKTRKELKADAVKETQDRNTVWSKPCKNLKEIGGFLSSLYPNNQKTVMLWGYKEIEAKPAIKHRKVTLKPLSKKGIKGIVFGSELINNCLFDFILRKGRTGVGKAQLVKAGETFDIIKGYSAIVIENTLNIGNVTFIVTVN